MLSFYIFLNESFMPLFPSPNVLINAIFSFNFCEKSFFYAKIHFALTFLYREKVKFIKTQKKGFEN